MSKQYGTYLGLQENPIKNIPELVNEVLVNRKVKKNIAKTIYKKKKRSYYLKDEKGQIYKL